ncbi:hypothetical protein D3C71_1953190 [compost metagenome]
MLFEQLGKIGAVLVAEFIGDVLNLVSFQQQLLGFLHSCRRNILHKRHPCILLKEAGEIAWT